jgi:hypothetical protein
MSEPVQWRRMNIGGRWGKPWHVVGDGNRSLCNSAEFTAARVQTSDATPTTGRVCIRCQWMLGAAERQSNIGR